MFPVVAVDFDGTIAEHDRPDAAALDAIDELRADGRPAITDRYRNDRPHAASANALDQR